MPARYNASQTDGLAMIAPYSDANLVSAAVRTDIGQQQARRQVYVFPSLSGAGALNAGVDTVPIVWTMDLLASDSTTLESFLNKLRVYTGSSRRYVLEDELGVQRSHVELVSFTQLGERRKAGGGGVHGLYRVDFRWMQPYGGA